MSMPRKYDFTLKGELNRNAHKLAQEEGVTVAEVIRVALILLFTLRHARKEGYSVGVWKVEDGKQVRRTLDSPLLK